MLYLPVITDPVYRFESVNVATQDENPSSLLWWIRQVIAMRKRLSALGRGDMKFIDSSNTKVLSFLRSYDKQRIILVANLSQFSQVTTLNLSEFKDFDVTEVFSQNRFINVGDGQYSLTIGPYGYYWLQLDTNDRKEKGEASGELPFFSADLSWERLFNSYNEKRLFERKILPTFMKKCRWFGGKARVISKMAIEKMIPLKVEGKTHYLTLVEVHYVQRLPELYFLPLSFASADSVIEKVEYHTHSVVCRAEIQGEMGFVMDSSYDKSFRDFLLLNMEKKARLKFDDGTMEFNSSVFNKIVIDGEIDSKVLKADQSNTAIIYNDRYFFKFYRKLEREINPDLEIVRFLSENTTFANSPKYTGSIEFVDHEGRIIVFGLLQEKVENQGDAWVMTMDSLGRFYERVIVKGKKEKLPKLINKTSISFEESPELIQEFIGRGFYERVVRLGQRTAEMHLALASDQSNPAFAPEMFTANYQRSLYSSLRKLVRDRLNLLENSLSKLNFETRELAKKVLALEPAILDCFKEIYEVRINAIKTRIHGDYHLGQVLFTGKDFVIIDFEGEPGFSFSERRLKKNPLKDVAGMMRSFQYAAFGKILLNENYRQQDMEYLEAWAEQWQHYVSRYYFGAYLERLGLGKELSEENEVLIRTFLIEKAIYELGYELNGRPDWVIIPLRGIYYHMNRYFLAKEEREKKKSKK
jgi:maltose alpha-D-glucosyltransferase/alpha-amylase